MKNTKSKYCSFPQEPLSELDCIAFQTWDYMFHTDVIVPVITASGAIAGAILGTYFTGKHTLNLEEKRIKEQNRKEDEINLRVGHLVAVELVRFISVSELITKEGDKYGASFTKTSLEIDNQYTRLPIEMKISAFRPGVLIKIEIAYQFMYDNIRFFNGMYPRFESGEMTAKELIMTLPSKGILDRLQAALDALKDELKQ
jgi:hypothetical protein